MPVVTPTSFIMEPTSRLPKVSSPESSTTYLKRRPFSVGRLRWTLFVQRRMNGDL